MKTLMWIAQDLRQALRTLRKNPGFALIAIGTLSVGIAASTVMFSVFYGLLLNPFPYRDSHRLVTISVANVTNVGGWQSRSFFSWPEFRALQKDNRVFEDMVGFSQSGTVLYSNAQGTRTLHGAGVTGNTFDFYGVRPIIGRGINLADEAPTAAPICVMSYRLWHSEFGGNPKLLGTTLALDGIPRTLVGIMPPRFNVYGADIWTPIDESAGTVEIVGRLKPGVDLPGAAADLNVIEHRVRSALSGPFSMRDFAVVIRTVIDQQLGQFRTMLYALLAAVAMLLLIASSNVANLLLMRATVRQREMAIRVSMGASRSRLMAQVFAESLVLAMAAAVMAWPLAYGGVILARNSIPTGTVPPEARIVLNAPAMFFAIGIAIVAALLCGAAPAFHVFRGNSSNALQVVAGQDVNVRSRKVRSAFMVAEIALSMVLLAGAGLAMRSFLALTNTQLPFNPQRISYVRIALPRAYYTHPDIKPAFFQKVISRIEALPGVVSASESLMLPPNEGSWTDVSILGTPSAERRVTDFELCTKDYFSTLGLRLVEGRLFTEADIASAQHVAVVNQTLVKQYLGNEDPIGQEIKLEVFDRPFVDAPHNAYFEIIGVIADFKTRPEQTRYIVRPDLFLPASVAGFGHPLTLLVRSSVAPDLILKRIQQQVWAVDAGAAIISSGSIKDFLEDQFQAPRFEKNIFVVFALLALILVVVGVFSLMAYNVSLRFREIAIRMALGAQQNNVLGMILMAGLRIIAVGSLMGILAAFWLSRFMASQLWGASPSDPITYWMVVIIVFGAGILACWMPAKRATRVEPMITLHCE